MGARAQLLGRPFRARLRLQRGGAAGDNPAGRKPGDLPGLPPRRRQGGHAQLSRHPHLGELLGDGGALRRARGREVGHARRLSQRRRRHRPRPRLRLRHGQQGRGIRRAGAHAMGLRRQSQHGRRGDDRARLRSVPDRPDEGRARPRGERPLQHPDDPGDRRHAQDRSRRASSGSRRCCRSSTRPSARRCRRAS